MAEFYQAKVNSTYLDELTFECPTLDPFDITVAGQTWHVAHQLRAPYPRIECRRPGTRADLSYNPITGWTTEGEFIGTPRLSQCLLVEVRSRLRAVPQLLAWARYRHWFYTRTQRQTLQTSLIKERFVVPAEPVPDRAYWFELAHWPTPELPYQVPGSNPRLFASTNNISLLLVGDVTYDKKRYKIDGLIQPGSQYVSIGRIVHEGCFRDSPDRIKMQVRPVAKQPVEEMGSQLLAELGFAAGHRHWVADELMELEMYLRSEQAAAHALDPATRPEPKPAATPLPATHCIRPPRRVP